MKNRIKHLFGGIKGSFVVLFTFLLFPFARLFLWRKNIWVVTERKDEARDNGYAFFKYVREKHEAVNCFYAINKTSPDYNKIEALGNVVEYGSLKHFVYYCAARFLISSTTQGFCPSYYLTLLRKKMHLWGKYIFLQHGITKDDQKFLYKNNAKIDLFICGAKPEYDDIKTHYGYKNNEVVYTGFSRFDSYFNLTTSNQILVMPTWRRYIENLNFENTDYYKTWFSFINSVELNNVLIKNNLKLIFYLHPILKSYSYLFKSIFPNIEIATFEKHDLQTLIRESKLLITDFSSLAFDYGYMKRPVIYYQFDEDEYFKKHYIKGYFDYRRDGFGPVINNQESVVNEIKNAIECGFESRSIDNIETFFPIRDNKNCERIFDVISKVK